MLDVPEIHSIRVLWQRGFSKRQIARMLHVSRKTVDKVTAEEYVVEPQPRMKLSKPRPSPRMDPWKPVIDEWLRKDEEVPRKQRRTARRIYQQLVDLYGAEVSEASVRRYVRRRKREQAQEAYVPLEFPPGAMAEADFGHALVILGEDELTLPFFGLELMASGMRFVQVYPHEKLEAVLDGVQRGLQFFGGVPQELFFDNLKPVVQKILAGGRRLQTPEFRALAAHYGFNAVFANPGAGNEKGGVESLVQWAERNLFSPVPQAPSLEALNAWLLEKCLEDARIRHHPAHGPLVWDLWEQEQAHLGSLPRHPFPACRRRFVRVDKTCLVHYDQAAYSVPPEYVGRSLLLRAFWDHVEVAEGEKTVAVHARQKPGGVSLHLEHYLPVLERKPRAVRHAAVIARGEPAVARYRDAFLAARPEAYRELVAILRLAERAGVAVLARVLETADRHHAYDLASVEALLAMEQSGSAESPGAPLGPEHLGRWPETSVPSVDPEAYSWLEAAGRGGAGR